jgi:hypothetical protein
VVQAVKIWAAGLALASTVGIRHKPIDALIVMALAGRHA